MYLYYDKRPHKVLFKCILKSGSFIYIHCVFIFQKKILNSAEFFDPGAFWVLWDLLLFLSSFSAILLGDVIACNPERFTKNSRNIPNIAILPVKSPFQKPFGACFDRLLVHQVPAHCVSPGEASLRGPEGRI